MRSPKASVHWFAVLVGTVALVTQVIHAPDGDTQVLSSHRGEECTILGTPNNDRLRGTSADDVLFGRGGQDVLLGRGGDDMLRGGPGDDRLVGSGGEDRLVGRAGPT